MEKTEQTEISPFAVQGVLAALKEVQDTVRAYDTKAQIVGVGFIFSIGIITGLGERLPAMADFSALLEPIQFTPVHILQRRNSFGIPCC